MQVKSSSKLKRKEFFELMELLLFSLTTILIDLRYIVCEIGFDKKEIKKEEGFHLLLNSVKNHRF